MGAACSECKGLAGNGKPPVYCSKCNPAPAKAGPVQVKKPQPETAED